MIMKKSKTKQEFEKYAQQAITQTTVEVCVNDAHKLIYIKTKQMLEHTHTPPGVWTSTERGGETKVRASLGSLR